MTTYQNGLIWQDIEGNDIHAHGGHMLQHDGYYYWYGEDRTDNNYVSCYRSKDLADWEFRHHILTTETKTEEYRVRTQRLLQNEDGTKVNLERPKVLYNELTQQFVLWVHFENGKDYMDAACAVAVCDTPDGDFTYYGHFNPYGYTSRDCTLFKDTDGTAYFISAARDNADLHVYRLSEDYLNVESLVSKLWQGEYREAPAVALYQGRYYMLSSFCTGWAPNQCKYSVADSMEGPWEDLMLIGDDTTFGSQPSFLLQVGETLCYWGDRWQGDLPKYFSSGYTVYPLMLSADGLRMLPSETVTFAEGQVSFT